LEIDLALRELHVRGATVTIANRPFEIIELLVRAAGKVVTKDDLMDQLWPGAIVEDNTIQAHMSAIRRALGPDRAMLKTVSGRGYKLLGNWTIRESAALAEPGRPIHSGEGAQSFFSNVPIAVSELIGRELVLQHLDNLIAAYRVVTLTGPGGIGKTALAGEVARRLYPKLKGDACFVELASLLDPELVPSAVAGALGLQFGGVEITPRSVAEVIGNKKALLILDNCEHVVDGAANFVEILLNVCPRCTILVTSREVLRVEGECTYRVPPLEIPPLDEEDPASVLGYSAVELFVRRARARDSDFSPLAENLSATAAICRHLDGIPLAIEFAAARAAALGVKQVAAGLHDRFALLSGGRRTILPRHKTLRAVLDWSHELLPEDEKLLLRRLSVFPAGFTLDAAVAVMGDTGLDARAVTEGIANLVFKSLLSLSKSDFAPRWHLLETTRAYAMDKLVDSGQYVRAARRHAEFYLMMFAPFAADGQLQTAIDALAIYRREIDNFRSALNWAFSAEGDSALGIALAAAGADFWIATSLVDESYEWSAKALAQLGTAAGTRHEMILQCNLGMTGIYTRGMIEDAQQALKLASSLARASEDFDYQQRTTLGLWLYSARSSALAEALDVARRYEKLIHLHDRHSRAVADWLVGIPHVFFGEHIEASLRLLRAITQYPIENRNRDTVRFGSDLLASATGHVSVSLLSRGLLDAASRTARYAVEEARGRNQPTVLCVALAFAAGFVALSLGELDIAESYGEELISNARKHALLPFHAIGLCIRGSLEVRRADPGAGVDLLRRGITGMQEASYLLFYPFFLVELATALGAMGNFDESLVEIDTTLRFAEQTGHRWFVPETLRVQGELLARRSSDNPTDIANLFRESIRQARQQKALYWELSAAISLTEYLQSQLEDVQPQALLASAYNRFTEGFSTLTLKKARALLGSTASTEQKPQ
jgi:non-specific serine/threonine protein kinase